MTKEKILAEESAVRAFFTMPFKIEGKGGIQILRIKPTLYKEAPIARIVGVTGKHHDVSNSFRVQLVDIANGSLFAGTLGDLYSDVTTSQLDGSDFELVVKNHFEHKLLCPRLRFDIACLVEV